VREFRFEEKELEGNALARRSRRAVQEGDKVDVTGTTRGLRLRGVFSATT